MAYEYKVAGQTVRLEVEPNIVAVRFSPTAPKSLRATAVNSAGLTAFSQRVEIPEEGITLIPASGFSGASLPENEAISTLSARPEIVRASPVFRVGDNKVVPSDRIIVGLNNPSALEAIVNEFHLALIRQREGEYLLQVPHDSDPLVVSNEISKRTEVRFSEPDFITVGIHLPKSLRAEQPSPLRSDPLLPRQYAMAITGAVAAQELVSGHSDVRIAVLDEGVDTNHRDLAQAIVGTYDGTDNDTYQQPNPWDGHGTSCAGLAAAIGNNDVGIRGVGAGCSILAVRIAYSRAPRSEWFTTNESLRAPSTGAGRTAHPCLAIAGVGVHLLMRLLRLSSGRGREVEEV